MLKNIIITGLVFFFAAGIAAPNARAGNDHGGFGVELFTDKTPDGLKDPVNASADADAAAATSLEPAAGGNNPFAATQGTEEQPGPPTTAAMPAEPAVAGKSDSGTSGGNTQ